MGCHLSWAFFLELDGLIYYSYTLFYTHEIVTRISTFITAAFLCPILDGEKTATRIMKGLVQLAK
jgi:hypothetical protein